MIAGIVGFYLGRNALPQNRRSPQTGVQQPGQQDGQPQGPPPTGGQQPLQRGTQPLPDPNQ